MKELDEIVALFEMLDDWDQRYQYFVEIGERLPLMPDGLKTEGNRVKGCMSQVWICATRENHNSDLISYQGDCDTAIVKGVLALLIQLCSHKTAEQVLSLDVDEFFLRLHIDEHLSPNRHVGIYAIVDLIKSQAAALSTTSAKVA